MDDGSIKLGVELNTDNLKKDLNDVKNDTEKTFDGVGDTAEKTASTVEKSFDKTLTSLQSLGKKTALIFTTSVSAIALASLNVGKNFEAAMDKVGAISGATENDLDKLSKKALELGANTKFSATESAEALQYMAMAGWKTEDMLDGITGVMNLATASGEDLALVSDIVTDSLTAFGMQASESGRLADVLASASANANTNVSMLGESFKYVAPVAGALSYSIEDTSVALGLMANAGIKASQAGTSLRTFLSNLAAPTTNSAKALQDLSITLEDNQGQMLPLSDVLQQLRGSFEDLTEAEKAQYAEMLAGKEGLSGLLAIVNASESDFDSLTSAINNSAGASERMAQKMQDNLQGSLTKLKSTTEAIGISFSQVLIPIATKVIDKVQGLAEMILNLDDGQKKLLVTVPLVATGIIAISTAGYKAYTTIQLLQKGFELFKTKLLATSTGALAYSKTQSALNTVMGTFKSKVGIAITVLGLLSIAFKDVDGVGEVLKGTLTVLLASFTAFKVVTTIQKAMQGLTVAMVAQNVATKAGAVATALWNTTMKAGATTTTLFSTVLKAVTTATTLFNTALKANPIGVVVTAVVGLTTAVTLLVKAFTKASKEAEEYNKGTQKIIDSTNDLNSSIEDSASAYEENSKSITNSIKANQMLAEEIMNLANAENLSQGQKLLLQQKIDELNSSVEGLGLSYDEETGKLNMNTQAIEEQLRVQQAQLELNADLEEQARIRQDIAEATELHEQALSRLAEVEMKLNETENLSYGDRKLLLEQQKELQQATTDTQANIESLTTQYDELGVKIEENATIVEQANEIKASSEEEYQGALDATGKAMEKLTTLTEEQKEKALKTLDELTKYTTDAFNKINKEAGLSVDELIDNLNSNTDTVEQWTNDLEILMERGVDEAFIQTLRDAGPQVADTVSNLVNASDEKIAELNTSFERGTTTAINSMLRQFGLPEVLNAGSDMIDDLAKGVENNDNLKIASENAIKDAKDSIDNQVDESNFDSAGKDMVTGVAQGIKDNKSVVNNAIRDVAREAVATFKSELDIHSPSRVFKEQAEYINQGIKKGLEATSNLPINAIKDVADSITDNFDGNVLSKNISKTIENSIKKIDVNVEKFGDIGEDLINALTDNIDNNKDTVLNSVDELVKEMLETANDEIDAESTSLINNYTDSINKKIANSSISKDAGEKLIEDYTNSINETADEKKKDIENVGIELMSVFTDSLEEGANKANELIKEKLNTLTQEFQNELDTLQKAQENLEKSLSSTKLFDFDADNNLIIENLDETINKLDEYDRAISQLKEKGISDAILNELASYDVDEALKISENLLEMTDTEFEALNKKWEEKQQKATEVASNFYKEQIDALEKEFNDRLLETLNELPDEVENIGLMTIAGFEEGLTSKMESIKDEVRAFADSIISEMQRALDIHSPSRKMKWLGEMTMDGYDEGIEKSSKGVLNNIKNLPILDYFKQKIPSIQSAIGNTLQTMLPTSSSVRNNSTTNNITNNQGAFNVNIDKIQTSNENQMQAFWQQLEFCRKQQAMAIGGV